MVRASTIQSGNTVLVYLKLGLALELNPLPNGKFDRVVPSKVKTVEEWSWTRVLGRVSKYENGFLYLECTQPLPCQALPYSGPSYSTVIHYSAIKKAQLIDTVCKAPKVYQFEEGRHPLWDAPKFQPYQTKQDIVFP